MSGKCCSMLRLQWKEKVVGAATSSFLPLSQDLFPSSPHVLAPSDGSSSCCLGVKGDVGGPLLWGGRGRGELSWSLFGEEIDSHLNSGLPKCLPQEVFRGLQSLKGLKYPTGEKKGRGRGLPNLKEAEGVKKSRQEQKEHSLLQGGEARN